MVSLVREALSPALGGSGLRAILDIAINRGKVSIPRRKLSIISKLPSALSSSGNDSSPAA
jgi:hypothetical protein